MKKQDFIEMSAWIQLQMKKTEMAIEKAKEEHNYGMATHKAGALECLNQCLRMLNQSYGHLLEEKKNVA